MNFIVGNLLKYLNEEETFWVTQVINAHYWKRKWRFARARTACKHLLEKHEWPFDIDSCKEVQLLAFDSIIKSEEEKIPKSKYVRKGDWYNLGKNQQYGRYDQ